MQGPLGLDSEVKQPVATSSLPAAGLGRADRDDIRAVQGLGIEGLRVAWGAGPTREPRKTKQSSGLPGPFRK